MADEIGADAQGATVTTKVLLPVRPLLAVLALVFVAIAAVVYYMHRADQREQYFRCLEMNGLENKMHEMDLRQADLNCKEWYGQ